MHLLRELVVTTLFLLVSGVNAELYGKKSAVFQLDHKNFQKEILNSDNAAVCPFPAMIPVPGVLTSRTDGRVSSPSPVDVGGWWVLTSVQVLRAVVRPLPKPQARIRASGRIPQGHGQARSDRL